MAMKIFEKLRKTLAKSTNLLDEDKIRNRADISQQYADSEYRDKNYRKKKKRSPLEEMDEGLDYKNKQLRGLGGP